MGSHISYVKSIGECMLWWDDKISSDEYSISLTASYEGITSDKYTFNLKINSREPKIVLSGTKNSYEAKLNTPGATDKITVKRLLPDEPREIDVTSTVMVSITTSDSLQISWDPTGYFRWNPTVANPYSVIATFDPFLNLPTIWNFQVNVSI